MYIRSLLGFFRRTAKKKDAVKQDSLFLNLPLALVYDIFDELQLSEKILLSQTCRDLWYILRHQCSSAMRQVTVEERLECLTRLGNILPDHRLCTSCPALHILDPKDLPVVRYDNCPSPESAWDFRYLTLCYSLAFRHVQLAIKYTRLKDYHQDYLAKILQPFRITIPKFYSMRLTFAAIPVIIHGRFILMKASIFNAAVEPISFSTISKAPFGICPHLSIWLPVQDNPLLEAMRSACNDGQCGLHSCDRCPTDYRIITDCRGATLYVWQDLGAGTCPADPYWRSHIYGEDSSRYRGTKFNYQHGSVKDLYYSRGTEL